MSVIDRCPSGALSYRKIGAAAEPHAARIRVARSGPLLVEGVCALIDSEGKQAAASGPFALCRCGASKKKPFCDGTHIKIGFDEVK